MHEVGKSFSIVFEKLTPLIFSEFTENPWDPEKSWKVLQVFWNVCDVNELKKKNWKFWQPIK